MLKSPSTFSFTVVLMRVMMFWLLIVASTRYFPSIVMATTCTFSGETTLPSRPFLELLPAPERSGVGARHPRGLQEAVRRQPDIELVDLGELRRHGHGRAVAVHVPRDAAVDDVGLPDVLLRRRAADPAEAVLP